MGATTASEWSSAERLVSGPAPNPCATRPPVDVQSVLCGDDAAGPRSRRSERQYEPRRPLTQREVPVEGLGFTFRPRHGTLGKALSHARLPTRPSCPPTSYDLGRQPQADELARVGRARTPALLDDSTSKHVVGEFREFLVLDRLDDMRVNARQIRAQSTARDGFAHDR